MPEGHTIHRLAREHRAALSGGPVSVSSPQGRFRDGAARLDGRALRAVEAHGKHLFYRFVGVDEALHVHLGLVGAYRTHRGHAPPPGAGVRLRMAAGDVTVDLAGPMTCELLDPGAEAAVREALGPDPLRRDRPDRMYAALARRRAPVGAALLDQRVVAGIGNVYRAEALFLVGVHPDRPAMDLTGEELEHLWETLRRELRAGVRLGMIVTVDPAEVGAASRARAPDEDRLYVYRRAGLPCRRCGATIESWNLGGRTISACPACQPR